MASQKQQSLQSLIHAVKKNPAGALVALVIVLLMVAFNMAQSYLNPPAPSAPQSEASSSAAPQVSNNMQAVVVTHVSDGDTLKVQLPDGTKTHVRLVGIDTPESVAMEESRNSEEGVVASDYTKTLVHKGQTVWLERDESDTDHYGRLLRYVWLEPPADPSNEDEIASKMLDAILVREGYAQVKRYWPDVKHHDLFMRWGNEAIAQGKGVTHKWA